MENSIYEEYMRSVLGYQPVSYENTYKMDVATMNLVQKKEIEDCYPDIYRIVYPIVRKVCNQNTQAITKEVIDDMVNEICLAVGDDDIKSERSENRQIRGNTNLNDLVRILVLRELLGGPQRPPQYPPMFQQPSPNPPQRPPVRQQYPPMRAQSGKDMRGYKI